MNEVRATNTVIPAITVPASSKGSGVSGAGSAPSGKELPQQTAEAMKEGARRTVDAAAELADAVAQMNQYIQSEQRDLHFSVDEASGETIVRVVDRETGDLVRQIPNEIFLTLAEQARKNEAIHLFSASG